MANSFKITDASVQNTFKIEYKDKSLNTYNGKVPLLGRVNKHWDFTGLRKEMMVPFGYQGGVGSGTLPRANRGIYEKPTLTRTKQYAVCEVDRETIKASSSEGAFVAAMKESVKKTVEKFNWNIQRQLHNSLTNGSLGTIESVVAAAPVYTLVISAATWKLANFEVRDFVNIESGDDSLFEITSIVPATRTVVVSRISGSQIPVAADVVFLQGSEGNDIQSLVEVLMATSGTYYNIPIGYRWQSTQVDADQAGISADLLNEASLGVDSSCGLSPNLGMTGHTQFKKMLAFMEDQKQYPLGPKAENLVGKISFSAVEYYTVNGAIPVIVDRFCDADKFMLLEDNYIELHHAPDFGWFDDEGFVFLRKGDDDAYDARYGGYMNSYIPPTPQAIVHDLNIT